ncbi:MAG: M48 family metalloprotease [Synergistaceae bacterium]|jgi:putative metalloprotease|nr:M48 family metalloprotease [Synergistaceae bacterium]
MKMNFWKTLTAMSIALTALTLLCGVSSAALSEKDVREAWTAVCAIAEIKPLPLSIKDDKSPNAWVTAGESVTVTTALMGILEREEEIFGVLSHEVGHVVLNHYGGRVNNVASVSIASLLLGKVLGDNAIGNAAVGVAANLAVAGFSREQEVEADDYAVDLAFKGGKDPTGIYTSLERLALYGGETTPSGFNSHPPDERRLRHVRERIWAKDPEIVIPEVKNAKTSVTSDK